LKTHLADIVHLTEGTALLLKDDTRKSGSGIALFLHHVSERSIGNVFVPDTASPSLQICRSVSKHKSGVIVLIQFRL
jgi:hypothetical protein